MTEAEVMKDLKDIKFEDLKEFYSLKVGETVDELPILFPRLDVEKELEELSKIVTE